MFNRHEAPRLMETPGQGTADNPLPTCENCGTTLQGPFCHACGQTSEGLPRTFLGLTRHFLVELSNLDYKTLRSFYQLLTRPGALTADYLAGRRIQAAAPFNLYLIASALFFIANTMQPFLKVDPVSRRLTSRLGGIGINLPLPQTQREDAVGPELFIERFQSSAIGYLPTFLITTVVLFTLAMAIFYRRSDRPFLYHVVFSLHWSAFYLLLMITDRVLFTHTPQGMMEGFTSLIAWAYLAAALRRVFGGTWRGRLIQAFGLMILYFITLGLWMAMAIAVAWAIG